TRSDRDWSSDVCSSDLAKVTELGSGRRFSKEGQLPGGAFSPRTWTSHHKIERLPRRSLNLRPGTERLSTPCLQARLRVVRDSKRSEERRVGKGGRWRRE